MKTSPTPPRIHVLAKPTGAVCNLDCAYCFFLDKQQLQPGSGRKFKRCQGAEAVGGARSASPGRRVVDKQPAEETRDG